MRKLNTWFRNLKLAHRVIVSMNVAIVIAIVMISVFATINRINVQKKDARALVDNELTQIANLLGLLQDRPLIYLEDIIQSKTLYNTGYISIIDTDGNVLICRNRKGESLANANWFTSMRNRTQGEVEYINPRTGETNFQYHIYYEPMRLFITATLEKKEFITKPVYNTLMILVVALLFTLITFSTVNALVMRTITRPIHGLVSVVRELGKGDLADTFDYPYRDEVGQMTVSVNELVKGLQRSALFASEIGKNNFDHPFEPLSEKDLLGNALLEMHRSLKTASEEEKIRKIEDEKRNWTTQGLAKFADILRQNNDNIKELTYDIIRNLVDYLDVNQGGVFILNDDDKDEKFLDLTACYAFDRRKHMTRKILPGEGLVGTCFLEQESIYIKKVPQDYIRITSGLGDENPSALLLIPLKVNEQIYGVIELASFKHFDDYKREFVEKIGESIASTISSVKINTQTAQLLAKSQQQAEEMRAQEEEMRQNMEELAATQEAMADKEQDNLRTIDQLSAENEQRIRELESKEKEILDTLENCPEGVVKSDHKGKIILFNKAAEKLWGYEKEDVLGRNVKFLMSGAFAQHHDSYMQNYLSTGEKKIIGKGREVQILAKGGQEYNVFLTIVETQSAGEVFFTGFFTDLSQFTGTVHTPEPLKGDDPDKDPSRKVSETKNDTKENTPIDPADLHQGDATDNQKAWTDHITQKGQSFRKSKKK